MKVRKLSVALCAVGLWMFSYNAKAQVDNTNRVSIDTRYEGGGVKEIKLAKRATEGTHFMYDNWMYGDLHLFNGQVIEKSLIKYDIERNRFEIKEEDIKVLGGERVKNFEWQKTDGFSKAIYVNCASYFLDGVPLIGFFEVLADGENKLLAKTNLDIIKANFDPKFDVGSKADEIVKKEVKYLSKDNDLMIIKKKKSFLLFFEKKSNIISTYIKKNKLSTKSNEDLIRIIEYSNTL